jgi:hypothetical protein
MAPQQKAGLVEDMGRSQHLTAVADGADLPPARRPAAQDTIAPSMR